MFSQPPVNLTFDANILTIIRMTRDKGISMKLIHRHCTVCNSEEFIEVFRQKYVSITAFEGIEYPLTVVLCSKCGFAYSNPSPAPEELQRYYEMFSNYENPQRAGKESEEMRNKCERACDLILKQFPPNYRGSVLEIGCATATGLAPFKTKTWDVLGIDPSPIAAKIAHDLYDIEVIIGLFDRKNLVDRGPFDIIVLSHVLEHLLSPDMILADLMSLLSDEGVIYIEVPNLLRPFVPMGYFSFEHLNYFTPNTLSSLMKQNGFEVDIELFDNSENIEPFYPVIAAIGKKDKKIQLNFDSDFDVTFKVIENYKKNMETTANYIQSKINSIIGMTQIGKLAIWGAGIHTSQLLTITNLSNESVAFVFDNDSKKHGKHINGVEIIGYDNPESIAMLVDSIIISSKASENEIYNQIKHLEEYGVSIHKLYDE